MGCTRCTLPPTAFPFLRAGDIHGNRFYEGRVAAQCAQVAVLAEDTEIQKLARWITGTLMEQPERVRRLLSHFGAIEGVDWGNLSYTVFWRVVLDWGPASDGAFQWARTWGSPNNCGNLIEAALAVAAWVPRIQRCSDESVLDGIRCELNCEHWAHPSDVDGAVAFLRQVARSRCSVMTTPATFLTKLSAGVRGVWDILYEYTTRSLPVFVRLTRHSTRCQLLEAAAAVEALRMGWPNLEQSLPGKQGVGEPMWVCLSISVYPDVEKDLTDRFAGA